VSVVHLHLLLNHIPTVGFGVGLGLFFGALIGKSREVKRAALAIVFLTAALAILTYVTGSDAQVSVVNTPGVASALIDAHETAALIAFAFMQATAFFAWLGLWMWRRIGDLAAWNRTTILLLAVVTFGLMARAANLGGEIRHPEIRTVLESDASAADAAPGERVALARRWGKYVEAHAWVWPTCETLHFVGLCLLFGAALVVDLRILGIAKRLPLAAVYQLLPLGIIGFTLNLVTGMAFFVAMPQQYIGFLFLLKMSLVVLAATNILYFMLADEPWTVAEGDDMPIGARLAAASAILIWLGVLFCGRMLPALGNSF
jgi:hypothetical protein